MRGGLLVAALLLSPLGAHASDGDDRRRAAVKASLDSGYQTLLPGEGKPDGTAGGSIWHKRDTGGKTPSAPIKRVARDDVDLDGGGAFGAVANVLMWVVVAVGVGLLVVYAIREFSGEGGKDATTAAGPAPPDRDQAVVEQPLIDADELARAGRYAEAIHMLLLRTLRELAARTRVALPRSLTSREILRRVDLADEPRAALGDLVTATELCHFGDDEAVEADYERCRRQFHVFAAAYQGAPRAA